MRLNIVDRPNQPHKIHQTPIPYLGGLAILLPFAFFALIAPLVLDLGPNFSSILKILLGPSLIISLVGLWDDLKSLPALHRLVIQVSISIVCSVVLTLGGFSSAISSNQFINQLVTIIWLVGITNALNFIDNLDGSASKVSFITSVVIFILALLNEQYLLAYCSIVMAGTTIGFYFWNKNPAKIYLGDCGSLFIGLTLAILLLQYQPKDVSQSVSLALPILILSIPVLDSSVALLSRLQRGIPLFTAGRDHLSHRLRSVGLDKKQTLDILSLISAIYGGLAVAIIIVPERLRFLITFLTLSSMVILFFYFIRIKISD